MDLFSNNKCKIISSPRLNFLGQKENVWNLNLLIVTQAVSENASKLEIKIDEEYLAAPAELLDVYVDLEGNNNYFWCYSLKIQQRDVQQKISYAFDDENYYFIVPAINQRNNFAVYSCNGYQTIENKEKVGGIEPMWNKLGVLHEKEPFHLLIGGGDQIYADGVVHEHKKNDLSNKESDGKGVFSIPTIKEWLNNRNPNYKAEFSDEMKKEVEQFYFSQYIAQYSIPALKTIQSQIAQMVTKDDHDIVDGQGSNDDLIENSPVMQGIYSCAERFYLLFQQHLSPNKDSQKYGFGSKGYSYLREFNNGKIAVLSMDTRSERTQNQIISNETWSIALEKINKLEKCNHLLVVLAVPVVYPSLSLLLKIYKVASFSDLIEKIGDKIPGVKNQFGEWELQDDVRDHWSVKGHIEECHKMIELLQNFSTKKNIRVTFISGDVHLAGLGKIESTTKKDIYQLFTSPMGNVPAPSMLLWGLEKFKHENINSHSKAGLTKWDNSNTKLINERNFTQGCLTPRERNLQLTLYPEKLEFPLSKKIPLAEEVNELEENERCCSIQ